MGTTITPAALAAAYFLAKDAVVAAGYRDEIDLQSFVSFELVTEEDFLREAAWVILSTGMREQVIRRKFGELSLAFLNWKSASSIVEQRAVCRRDALCSFGHVGKIDAILNVSERVVSVGFDRVKVDIAEHGADYLQSFDFIGPVTSRHLAKNIGLDVMKPDRHLVRMSAAAGTDSPDKLCQMIADVIGEKISIIDTVLWRFATLESEYLGFFTAPEA